MSVSGTVQRAEPFLSLLRPSDDAPEWGWLGARGKTTASAARSLLKLLLSPVHACVKCPAKLMGWSCRINNVDSGLKTLKEFISTDFRDLKIYSLSSLRFLRQLPNQTE